LALEAGQVVSVQRILDEIWGEEIPSDPTNAVQARVSGLRKAIGPGVVVAYGGGYRLEVSPDAVDIVRFERGLAHGRDLKTAGDDEAAARALRACLELWRGAPLDGLAGLGFARDEAARLEELRLNAIEDCIDAELRLGRHAELTSELTELTRAHPFSEGFAAQLMLGLYRCGRQIEALQVYRELSRRLLEEFGLEPGLRLRELESAILRQEPDLLLLLTAAPSGPMTSRLPRGNLPTVPNSFVGRRDELATVRHLLAPGRLLTLTGPGGSGKTRLALEAAQAEVASTPDGVWLVELAPLATPIGLTTTVLRSLGVSESTPTPRVIDVPGVLSTSPEARLIDYLWDRQLLLVLDNCEHLIPDIAALVELILTRAPTVRVLATSREALDIDGETRLRIHPLEVPPVQASGGAQLEEYDAVRLFVDRARAVTPDFSIGDTTSKAVAAICRHLEGLPLALELAASQTRVLSAAQISGSLEQRFYSLVGGSRRTAPRHRTLQAAIDWSYERLEPGEQVLFESVSVFAGSFDIQAAQCLGGAAGLSSREASALLVRLIDKSLVVANTSTEVARYRLLEPLRLYGVSRLEQRGIQDEVRWQHALWYLARAEAAEPELRASPRQIEMAGEIERELDNLRVAFDWLVERHDAARAQRLAAAACVVFLDARARARRLAAARGRARARRRRSRNPRAGPRLDVGLLSRDICARTRCRIRAGKRKLEDFCRPGTWAFRGHRALQGIPGGCAFSVQALRRRRRVASEWSGGCHACGPLDAGGIRPVFWPWRPLARPDRRGGALVQREPGPYPRLRRWVERTPHPVPSGVDC
jgi:predicted ATPase/DNA-binding SARP family transcriptional activator